MAKEASDVLIKIKRAVVRGQYRFSNKAQMEMDADGITEMDVIESILNAVTIYKKLRSRSPVRRRTTE